MDRLMLISRVVETVVLAPILFFVLWTFGDHVILAFVLLLLCLFASGWLRDRLTGYLIKRRQLGGRHKSPTA